MNTNSAIGMICCLVFDDQLVLFRDFPRLDFQWAAGSCYHLLAPYCVVFSKIGYSFSCMVRDSLGIKSGSRGNEQIVQEDTYTLLIELNEELAGHSKTCRSNVECEAASVIAGFLYIWQDPCAYGFSSAAFCHRAA